MSGPVVVGEAELRRFASSVLQSAGMSAADAELVATALVWSELRGQGGHGLSRLPLYLDFIARGFLDPHAQPAVSWPKDAVALVDAKRAAGAVAMNTAVAVLGQQAKASGLAFALVRNVSHTGAIGCYAAQLAESGLATLIAVAGPPLMAYHGAAVASASTSPLALAVPGAAGAPPIVLDMATSVAAMGKIMQARRGGKPIPPDWALAADGAPTTDAAAAVLPLPLAGPKGSGLSLMFELMTGVMAGNPILAGAIASEETRKNALNGLQNAMLFAIDVEVFRPLADFRADAASLAATLKALPKQSGTAEILLPGEGGDRRAEGRRTRGIPVPPPLWETLTKVAAARNVPLPAAKI